MSEEYFKKFVQAFKVLYFGGKHNTCATSLGGRGGRGDGRKITNLTLSPVLFLVICENSLFGGEGWILSVDDLEDIFGG